MRNWLSCGTTLTAGALAAIGSLVVGCASSPKPAPAPPPTAAPLVAPRAPSPAPQPAAATQAAGKTSAAQSAREYRRDAAGHLYGLHAQRIYQGKMPPLLYAVGVLQVEVDGRGNVLSTHWMRAPSQAPEVMLEIERMVLQAAPYPAPVKLGRVTYTDTWLWHTSGQFQLDTLTEGQL